MNGAIVTGGASGLGEAIARRLAAAGATVTVADVDEAGAARVAKDVEAAGGRAQAVAVDVTREADVAAMVAAAGPVDVLVLSAAVEVRKPLVDTTDEEWQRVVDVCVKGPFLCMKHAIPGMAAGGGGSVIALGSILGLMGAPEYSAYCAAKGALLNLCKQAAIEHAPDKVRVNYLAPSACEAGLFMQVTSLAPDPDAVRRMVAARTPMGRLGTVDDVCETVLFLASDGSSYISGAALPLDGGLAARRV
jgi:NAD(P)-dependent dehydrogenase (short-subunit alcohol dehydrogenase family)